MSGRLWAWLLSGNRSLGRRPTGRFVVEKPRVWFEKGIANFPSTRSYDPAPDGKSIVALMRADTPEETHDRVIFPLNFFDELRRRVPAN